MWLDLLVYKQLFKTSGLSGLVLSRTLVSGELGFMAVDYFAHFKALGGLITTVFLKVKKILFLLRGYPGVGGIQVRPSHSSPGSSL